MHCCHRSCCPRRSCYHCIQLHGIQIQYHNCYQLYGLVLWWLELGEVVLPSPHTREQALLNHIKSNQTSKNYHDKSNCVEKNYNDKGNIYICHQFPHPFLTWRLERHVHKMFIKHRFGREMGFVHKDFITTFWSPKCFWWLEVMFIRKFIMALLWTILWIKC